MIHARIAISAGTLAAAALLLGQGAGTALAQTPAASQYSGNLGQTAHSGGAPASAAATTLPFTGADLAEIAGTGVVLIGAGALLRSRSVRRA
jgi:hypothetical protein